MAIEGDPNRPAQRPAARSDARKRDHQAHPDPAVAALITAARVEAWEKAHRGCVCKRTVGAPQCRNPYQEAS